MIRRIIMVSSFATIQRILYLGAIIFKRIPRQHDELDAIRPKKWQLLLSSTALWIYLPILNTSSELSRIMEMALNGEYLWNRVSIVLKSCEPPRLTTDGVDLSNPQFIYNDTAYNQLSHGFLQVACVYLARSPDLRLSLCDVVSYFD